MSNLYGPPFRIEPRITGGYLDDLLHIACTAQKEAGFCMEFLSYRSMPVHQVAELCDIVNGKKEVAALFPTYRVSLVPLADKAESTIPRKYLDDIFLAQRLYFPKCQKILFIFDNTSNYDLEAVRNTISSYIMEMSSMEGNAYMTGITYYLSQYPSDF